MGEHTVFQLVDWLRDYWGYFPSPEKIARMQKIIDEREPEHRGGFRAPGRKGQGRAKVLAKELAKRRPMLTKPPVRI